MSVQPIIVDEEAGESYQGLRMSAEEYLALPETKWYYELISGVVVQQFWGEPDPVGDYPPDREIYHGLRMTADEFLNLGRTFERYELVSGVVIMSPSPTPKHQEIAGEVQFQIRAFLQTHPIGRVMHEVDVAMKDAQGRDVVYRPDVLFIAAERWQSAGTRLTVTPDVVVEVVSRDSRPRDNISKMEDYAINGVREYWLNDPLKGRMAFYRLCDGRYAEVAPGPGGFASEAVPGFVLDLGALRQKFHGI